MGTMSIMDRTGHTETRWDPKNPTEVAVAKAAFDALLKRGFKAFALTKTGNPGKKSIVDLPEAKGVVVFKPAATLMRTFDVEAEEIIVQPAIAGG